MQQDRKDHQADREPKLQQTYYGRVMRLTMKGFEDPLGAQAPRFAGEGRALLGPFAHSVWR